MPLTSIKENYKTLFENDTCIWKFSGRETYFWGDKGSLPPYLHIFMYIIYIYNYIIIYITYIVQVCLGLIPLREEESLSFYERDLSTWWAKPSSSCYAKSCHWSQCRAVRRKTAVIIPKLLIKKDTSVTQGRRISKLDLEMIIQEGVGLMLMSDRQDLSMSSCRILGRNYFHFFKSKP